MTSKDAVILSLVTFALHHHKYHSHKNLRVQCFKKDLDYSSTSQLFGSLHDAIVFLLVHSLEYGWVREKWSVWTLRLSLNGRKLSRVRDCVSALPCDSMFSGFPGVIFTWGNYFFFLTIPCDGYHGLSTICNKEENPLVLRECRLTRWMQTVVPHFPKVSEWRVASCISHRNAVLQPNKTRTWW